jgi:hypothetical protein
MSMLGFHVHVCIVFFVWGLGDEEKGVLEALSSCFKLISSDNNIRKLGQVCIISEVIG